MEPCQHQPLPSPTSIRLIKFKPSEQSDDISCSFVIADTQDPPEYFAISYVWGKATDTVPINVDGEEVRVTINLREALQVFSTTSALVWADALCINQQDILERNSQVKLMSAIYHKAANVMVSLGPDVQDDASAVFEDIKALVDGCGAIVTAGGRFRHFDEDSGELHWQLGEGKNCVSALPRAIFLANEYETARLQRFFRLPWFSRTWVVQEVGLATEAVVRWGSITIQWAIIGLTAMFLVRYCKALLNKLNLTVEVQRVFHIYTAFSPFIPRSTFVHIINNIRCCHAGNPSDKVFALLSHPTAHTISSTTTSLNWDAYKPALLIGSYLLPSYHDQFMVKKLAEQRDESYTPPSELPPPLLQADYSKTTEEVYYDLAMSHITRTESLEILTAVQHDTDNTSALFEPSWVPRWDYCTGIPTLGLYISDHFASANRSVILTPPPSNSQNTLTVRGRLVTRISKHTDLLDTSKFELSLPATATGPDSAPVQSLRETNIIAKTWLMNLVHADPDSYPVMPIMMTDDGHAIFNIKATSIYEAYMRTWVAGKNLGEVDEFDLKVDFAAYWERLFWGTQGTPETALSLLMAGYSNPEVLRAREAENKMRWQRYRDSAAEVCNKRKFFFSRKGFFGLGPAALREEDFVAILVGADVPFVIREVVESGEGSLEERFRANKPVPMDRKFQLIGECYVEGLMQGQGVRGVEIVRDITLI